MRVFITGAYGQLGTEIVKAFSDEELFLSGHHDHDITDQQIIRTIEAFKPHLVVHTAACTDVDGCEEDPERALQVNGFGTRNVTVGAAKAGAKLVYLSTDYVFDGTSDAPYNEFSPTSPISVYGQSKLAGEDFVRHLSTAYFIVRTSWLYGNVGNNFVKTILRAGAEKKELRVVNDQRGSPTWAKDLARTIASLAVTEAYGIYHVTGKGWCSWYDFTREILRLASMKTEVVPITSDEIKRPASRPANSVLENLALRQVGIAQPHWKESLNHFMDQRES